MNTLIAAFVTFVACFIVVPMVLALARAFGLYATVKEGECRVYVLFGKVIAVLDEPGLHFLLTKLGWRAPIVNWLGRCHVLDMRLDQEYLRSQPVNSEEGAPMGIGIWYEMYTRCIPQLSVAPKPAPRGGTRPTKERTETVGPVPPPGATVHRQLMDARSSCSRARRRWPFFGQTGRT